ncbi:MAG: DegT/DnrJ/EryC1/StrS family aminotransferase [Acidimicrobiales bacterium]|nr:DegT/DnrJ/EryC1/StrS family aminotransferase [Acidimicrobiales bacterium]
MGPAVIGDDRTLARAAAGRSGGGRQTEAPEERMRMWANKRMDMPLSIWIRALVSCSQPSSNGGAAALERAWEPDGSGVAGLSVRSLFDLWLHAQGWKAGDRIVFSAFTVADMPLIARAHGLCVVALDIDPVTCEPDPGDLASLLDERTRAVVYTHLFGAVGRTEELRRLAHDAGALFVEDCAEAYHGPHWRGHPDSDLALFSFGPIKTATALGGGLARVPDARVRADMRARAATFPHQKRLDHVWRLVKFGALNTLASPVVFHLVVGLLDSFGPGYDTVFQRLTKSFPGSELLDRIRRQPSAPLVRTMRLRLAEGDAPIHRRTAPGRRLLDQLGAGVPAAGASSHAYWLVPVLAPDPQSMIDRLVAEGFHATRGRSFAVVEHDEPTDAPPPIGARRLLEQAVFLPFDPEMPTHALDRLGDIVTAELERQSQPTS